MQFMACIIWVKLSCMIRICQEVERQETDHIKAK